MSSIWISLYRLINASIVWRWTGYHDVRVSETYLICLTSLDSICRPALSLAPISITCDAFPINSHWLEPSYQVSRPVKHCYWIKFWCNPSTIFVPILFLGLGLNAVRREDTGLVVPLCRVSPTYIPFNNLDTYAALEDFEEAVKDALIRHHAWVDVHLLCHRRRRFGVLQHAKGHRDHPGHVSSLGLIFAYFCLFVWFPTGSTSSTTVLANLCTMMCM